MVKTKHLLAFFLFITQVFCFAQGIKNIKQNHVSQKEFLKAVNNLIIKSPNLLYQISQFVNPEDFKAQRKMIPKDMALINYILDYDSLYIFCATKDSIFIKIIDIKSKELRKEIMLMYKLTRYPSFIPEAIRGSKLVNIYNGNNPEKQLKETSEYLYEILIKPLKTEIASKSKLSFLPNADFVFLPVNALISKDTNNVTKYLIDEFEVFTNFSFNFLFHYNEERKLKILAIGNPDGSLPYAEDEVNNIKKNFPDTKVLVNKNATKSNFFKEKKDINIIHFATHGIFDFNNLDSSYIVMAKDKNNQDDGRFYIFELKNFFETSMFTEEDESLLVLSACETAVAVNLNNDVNEYPHNPITSKLFLNLGIQTVIASLWQVDDKATGLMMKYFYSNLQSYGKLDAWHKAQLDLSKTPGFSHPYYWAPFAYYGK